MENYSDKQQLIDRHREAMIAGYPALWQKMINEWNAPGPEDRAWLMYSANYLFRTAGIRWAMDPLTLKQRASAAPEMAIARDLQGLSFVLLTHRHADHLDLNLIRALSVHPIRWVVPADVLSRVMQVGISREKIIVPQPLETIDFHPIRVTPFDGCHWEGDPARPDERKGVPAMGYLVEFNGKSWLFPGDTRTYNIAALPSFDRVDGAFLHLWLGRASALLAEPPMLAAFCNFCIRLRVPRIVVTHLREIGRNASDYWDEEHFQQVVDRLQGISPDRLVESRLIGDSVLL